MSEPSLDQVFSALADPARRAMIERLCTGAASVKELAAPLGMGLPSAVKHLGVLEAGGLVTSTKSGRVRTYSISPSAFRPVHDWVGRREAAVNAAFDRLEQAMKAVPE